MNGVVEKIAGGARKPYFFIRGEDGKKYFGHSREVVNSNNHKRYCYVSNNVTFEPGEPDRDSGNCVAHNIRFENVSKERRFGVENQICQHHE